MGAYSIWWLQTEPVDTPTVKGRQPPHLHEHALLASFPVCLLRLRESPVRPRVRPVHKTKRTASRPDTHTPGIFYIYDN